MLFGVGVADGHPAFWIGVGLGFRIRLVLISGAGIGMDDSGFG